LKPKHSPVFVIVNDSNNTPAQYTCVLVQMSVQITITNSWCHSGWSEYPHHYHDLYPKTGNKL